jgi:RNA polymerase sigma-70 factor (ECF subfamily)
MSIKESRARHRSIKISGVSIAFLEHTGFLKKFLAKFLRNEQDIEDVAQEAYLKAYSAEQDKGSIEHPKAFLFSIAKNIALNELTRKSRQITDYIEECLPDMAQSLHSSSTVEGEVEADRSIGLYCEAVASLPEKCRRVYLLRKVHGLSHKEISERLNISRSAVEKHLSFGALSCRDFIDRYEGTAVKQKITSQKTQPRKMKEGGK